MSRNYLTLDPAELELRTLHQHLLSAVGPRPIAFASTVDKDGNVNLSPFSYFNVFSINPPILIFSPSRSGRDNTTKNTHDNVLEVPEVCINMVTYPIVEKMSLSSTAYDKGVNEFIKAGFTEVPSDTIQPPRVKESPVNIECTVDKVMALGDEGGAGNLVICRVQRLHINEEYLDEKGILDCSKLDLVGRMGGNWYTRADQNAMFEVQKPIRKKGIGVDQLPEGIRNSHVLSANNIGKLGNIENLPGEEELSVVRESEFFSNLVNSYADDPAKLKDQIHKKSKAVLEEGNAKEALKILMLGENLENII